MIEVSGMHCSEVRHERNGSSIVTGYGPADGGAGGSGANVGKNQVDSFGVNRGVWCIVMGMMFGVELVWGFVYCVCVFVSVTLMAGWEV